ncbi:Lacal_2735 family protein [Tenacibaculum sp. 190524A05c]|uniref:Lacal_2735 family protein n=1 Tax=Tenacibaculum platacis TaxID=3137852 RepID=UPI0032B1B9DA
MFGLFKKKSEKEKLQKLYAKLLADAHKLSTSNRKLSDDKVYEAEQVMKRIETIEKQSQND